MTGPLLLWLVVQLVALLVPAVRVPLAAKYPDPEELQALRVMVAVQVAAGSLLFPVLMANRGTAAAVVATAWPFQMLATALSATPLQQAMAPALYVTAWLASLVLWRASLPLAQGWAWGVAVASVLTVGGAALWYLRVEFVPGGDVTAAWFGPLVAGLQGTPSSSLLGAAWLWPLASASAAAATLFGRRVIDRRARA